MRVFRAWCSAANRPPLPATAETIELYIADLIQRCGRKVSTLARHVSGIQYAHVTTGHPNPCNESVRAILAGARRLLAERPRQKAALTLGELRRIITRTGTDTATRSRNSALLLLGFSTALRISNLALLDFGDMQISPARIHAHIRHEKQDRSGEGRIVIVPRASDPITCALRAIKRWIRYRGTAPGPLFQGIRNGTPTGSALRSGRITEIVKQAAGSIGLNPEAYGGHSLRSGFITEAILAGVPDHQIMEHTGHRSLEMLRRYFRPAYALRQNPCSRIGL